MPRVLLLGGTTEGSRLAAALAEARIDTVFSYAGRTEAPLAQPVPVRVGGFGGAEGLRDWLIAERISHVVDATHPFAAQMSRNAVRACADAGIPLLALERPAWQPQAGDRWLHVTDMDAALRALPDVPRRVFLAIGRQQVAMFLDGTPHWYLLRLVDDVLAMSPDRGQVVLARGPFTEAGDTALMREHGITHIVAKNSGGSGAQAKLAAARALGLPVILIDRPAVPARATVAEVDDVLAWLGGRHGVTTPPAERGV